MNKFQLTTIVKAKILTHLLRCVSNVAKTGVYQTAAFSLSGKFSKIFVQFGNAIDYLRIIAWAACITCKYRLLYAICQLCFFRVQHKKNVKPENVGTCLRRKLCCYIAKSNLKRSFANVEA
jgi:hypothetical protein